MAAVPLSGAEDGASGSVPGKEGESDAAEASGKNEAGKGGEKRRRTRESRFSGPSGGKEGWGSFSDEERSKLREALREVWSDAEVVGAREEIRRATEAYHKAVREAVKGADPSVEPLMKRLHGFRDGSRSDRGKGNRGGRFFGPERGMEEMMRPPGFLERLSDEQRGRFESAQKEARESPEVAAALEALEEVRKEDEAIRGRRLEALRGVRKAFHEAMAEADPEIAELLPEPGERHVRKWKKNEGKKPEGEEE